MTRKAPSGARHAPCLDHIPHDYPKAGWLCISTNTENVAWPPLEIAKPAGEGPYIPRGTVGRDMQPVDRAADMRAFADHIAAVAAQHRAAELARRDIPNDPMGGYIRTTDAKTGKAGRSPLAKQAGSHIAPRAADTAAILALAAELDARKGRAVKVVAADTYVAAVKVAKARKAAPVTPDPVQVVVGGTVVAETRHVDIAPEPTPEPGQRNDAGEPDARGTAAAHDFGDLCDCGECVQPGTPDPVEPEPAAEPIAPAAPVLAAVQPVTRPTCPRCGQVFRMKGAGLAWHLANRPDCAPARLSVAV